MIVERVYPLLVEIGEDLRRAVDVFILGPIVPASRGFEVDWVEYFVPVWISKGVLVDCVFVEVDELRSDISMVALLAVQVPDSGQKRAEYPVNWIQSITYFRSMGMASSWPTAVPSNSSAKTQSTTLTCSFHYSSTFPPSALSSKCESSFHTSCLVSSVVTNFARTVHPTQSWTHIRVKNIIGLLFSFCKEPPLRIGKLSLSLFGKCSSQAINCSPPCTVNFIRNCPSYCNV